MNCRVCHRPLRTPDSRAAGIGPRCRARTLGPRQAVVRGGDGPLLWTLSPLEHAEEQGQCDRAFFARRQAFLEERQRGMEVKL
jgi:hypothetical protein